MFLHKNPAKLVVTSLFVLILFIGQIRLFTLYSGHTFFYLELGGLLLLLALSVAAYSVYDTNKGEWIFWSVFVLYLGNLLLLWYFKNSLHVALVFLALVAIVVCLPYATVVSPHKRMVSSRAAPVETYYDEEEPHSEIFDENVKRMSTGQGYENVVVSSAKAPKKATAVSRFSPGKYVASKYSNSYHEPKCDWAKKINKTHQLWFKDKEGAWEKGYKAHDCVN